VERGASMLLGSQLRESVDCPSVYHLRQCTPTLANPSSLPGCRESDSLSVVTALTQLSEDERLFFDTVLDFAKQRIGPKVSAMDAQAALDPSLLPALFELGVMGVEIPAEYGGSGASFFNAILAVEALARVDPSVSVLVDVQNTLVINALLRWATPEQKSRYLPKMAGEWVGSYALSEASSGSDAFALKLRADRRGDRYVLNGR
jgi:alkylation response protein AidB-like acyl-CoA dehydrogenase